ncbi:DNA polymerase [Martelella mangrovi]|uniref:DNA polymerase I-like protein with 3'-5' exonuclease and polymerase domains n=1 Tax=Martelella mangrovi TaxID=1397477 RepID=A0ABV2IDZ8_9HYPH
MLTEASLLCGHNIIAFDIPALQKVYPWFRPKAVIRDTLVLTRLLWPTETIRDGDFKRFRAGTMPAKVIGRYSLEAWGYRLGNYKGDYAGSWLHWNVEMQEYCEQDVEVTTALFARCEAKEPAEESVQLEHAVQTIISRQEAYGFGFDVGKAGELYSLLVQRRTELEARLQEVFPPWVVETPFYPKVNNKARGYVKGELFIKRKEVTFNPSSRVHIAQRLTAQRGWEPKEYTDDGKPKVDETVLSSLPWPEAKVLTEFLLVDKRIGQLANGKQAWLKHVKEDGRIHGRVTTNGAVTGRMTHSHPNCAQVPSGDSPYGHECRSLWVAKGRGKVLVGADADALELCCLAGYMARHDNGDYVRVVLEGDKSNHTDIHSVNARALGCDRSTAKVWFYAFIYGAGDFKLGTILEAPPGQEMNYGKRSRARFLKNLPALGKITKRVKDRVNGKAFTPDGSKAPRHLKGLDGRKLSCRSAHSALNTLLQSAGAILMKRALVILDDALQAAGLVPGVNYEFVANVHDEWQIETDEDKAEYVGQQAVAAITAAGVYYNFGCPLSGSWSAGASWAETH